MNDFRTTMQAPDYRLDPAVFQLLAQAIQQKNQMYQGLGQSLGQTVSSGTDAFLRAHAQQQLSKDVASMTAPSQGPVTQTGVPPQQPPIDIARLMTSFSRAYPGQQMPGFLTDRFDPTKQAELAKIKAMTELDLTRAKAMSTGVQVPFESAIEIAKNAGDEKLASPFISIAQSQGRDSLNKQEMSDLFKAVSARTQSQRGDFYEGMLGVRKDTLDQTLIKDARETLNPYFQKGPGKDQAMRLDAISRIEPLITQMLSQPGGGDSRQMVEMATGLDRVIRGSGQQAQQQIEHLIPKTAIGKYKSWLEWFTSEPQGLQQQMFIKRAAYTIGREKQAIMTRVSAQAQANAPALQVLKRVDPRSYQAVLDSVTKQFAQPAEAVAGSNDFSGMSDDDLRRIAAGGK